MASLSWFRAIKDESYTCAMQYSDQLSIGDNVVLTPEGAKAHRSHHTRNSVVGGAAVAALAAPIAIGAGIGVAAAGTAIGVSTGTVGAAAGASVGAATSAFGSFPEGGLTGKIVDKKGRWWGTSGHDYEVAWEDGTNSWHLSMHITKI
jgi:hypothetical protein